MFEKALEKIKPITKPIVFISDTGKGVGARNGSYFILNDEGWILTIAHIFNEENIGLKRFDYWLGEDGVKIAEKYVDFESDIAVARIEPFNPENIKYYPIIKNPDRLIKEEPLAFIGYSALKPVASLDSNGNFTLSYKRLELIEDEDLVVGNYIGDRTENNGFFLETSEPSIEGQSGGPLFDRDGIVWGVQSRRAKHETTTITVENGIEKRQVSIKECAWSVHPSRIVEFLKKHNIKFEMER